MVQTPSRSKIKLLKTGIVSLHATDFCCMLTVPVMGKKDAKVLEDLEMMKEMLARCKLEQAKLESSVVELIIHFLGYLSGADVVAQPPINKLREDNSILKKDMEKFKRILEQYEARRKKLSDTIVHEQAELALRG